MRKIGEGPKIKIPKTSELQTTGSHSRSTNYSQTTVLYNTGTAVETISEEIPVREPHDAIYGRRPVQYSGE